jgi:hypothetical protein
MKTVFISCRVRGDTKTNLIDARRYYEFAIDQGVAPLMPHLLLANGILDDDVPTQRQRGIEISQTVLLKADEMWVVVDERNGISEGMLAEMKIAAEHGIDIISVSRNSILEKTKGAKS